MIRMRGVERQRLGDLDQLLLADAQAATRASRVELDAEPVEQRCAAATHARVRSTIRPGDQRLAAEEDVGGDARARERG